MNHLFFERFFCSIQSKSKTFILGMSLSQVSSLPILEIFGKGRADIFWDGVHSFLLH